MTIHLETVSDEQREAIRLLAPLLTSRQMYLAGGTSVALQLGHRRSVDLNWFSSQPIADPMALARDLRSADVPFETGSVDRGALHGQVLGVPVSLLVRRQCWSVYTDRLCNAQPSGSGAASAAFVSCDWRIVCAGGVHGVRYRLGIPSVHAGNRPSCQSCVVASLASASRIDSAGVYHRLPSCGNRNGP